MGITLQEMRGRGRGVVRGEKKRGGSVEKQAGEKEGWGEGLEQK